MSIAPYVLCGGSGEGATARVVLQNALSANEQVFCDIDLDADLTLSDFQLLQQQLLQQ